MSTHYDSRTEALILSKSDLAEFDDQCLDIYLLNDREVSLIMSCLRYAEWESRWVGRDMDTYLVTTLEDKLLRYCLEDLIKSNLRLEAAISGQTVDLDSDLSVYLTGVVDHSSTGLANRIGPEVPHDSEQTLQATIEAIKNILSETEEQDYTDELLRIGTILGALA